MLTLEPIRLESGLLLLPWATFPCQCVARHGPTPAYSQEHHIVPLKWGGRDIKSNRVPLCGSGHDWVHNRHLLWERAGGVTSSVNTNRYLYDIALQGWVGAGRYVA